MIRSLRSNEMCSLWVMVILLFQLLISALVKCDDSDPLILTPLLDAGQYKEAQEKALVVPDLQGIKSYTGYFTVNKECANNLFFWFTPAEKNWESAPVLLWLNGGPGCTSLFGMFQEIGPFDYVKKKGFVKKEHYWSQEHNVLYLDQPVGTGFSFTTKNCYAKDLKTLAKESYEALVQFFTMFPNLQKNNFYITGESYAGHSIPGLACEIDRGNQNAKIKINLIGVMVGNPALDERCHHNAAYLYQLGMVDEKSRDFLITLEEAMAIQITKGDYEKAIEASYYSYGNMSSYISGLPSQYNIAYEEPDSQDFQLFLRRYETRKWIHVGQTPYFCCNDLVYGFLEKDIYTPVNEHIQTLLQSNKYTVGFYSGHLDLACLYTSVPCVLRQLKWSGAADYLAANRSLWYVGNRLAGWYKTTGNLFEVVVRDSGHFVPTDQPEAALDLLKAFVADRPGSKLLTKLKTESA